MPHRNNSHRLDEIDRRILHALMQDSRNTSATSLAEQLSVSGATVRNRIHKLENSGIIRGYTAHLDFERAGGKLTNLYLCNVPVSDREALANEARMVPGVINVRALMTGRRNLHILAVGEDTTDLRRVARALSELDIEIEDEELVEDEFIEPYTPFVPEITPSQPKPNDFISLTGDSNVVEVAVKQDASIAGLSLEEVGQQGILDEDTLVIAIERDDRELTPHGATVIRPDDIVTLLSRNGASLDDLEAFQVPRFERIG
ncbi:Lrp/AsnC family transcriptional regulator [Haladaptatus sp. DYSN1]|uniref:Lrp/AsnC family transcriptional regulator n=1 Tax=unclassified Haladaptatus TaxID=2622732 RepID=UPI0024068AF1|nr:AsnC family transcriptional regulator [Haladaptatus sp. DYSN1]